MQFIVRTVFAALALACAAAPHAAAQAAGGHVINLRDADIKVFIEDVSSVTGYTFIVHPQVSGRVTVASQRPLSDQEVFETFLSTMRVNGYAVVPAGEGAYRVIPEELAASDGASAAAANPGQFATTVIQLDNVPAEAAVASLQGVVNPQGSVTANPAANSIIVVDYASNLSRVRQIVAQLDRTDAIVETVSVRNMAALEMAATLQDVLGIGPDGRLPGGVTVTPVRSGNSVVIRGEPAEVARIRGIVTDLDTESLRQDSLRVVRLEHANAADLAPVLTEVAASVVETAEGGTQFTNEGPRISFDPGTNAIILNGEPEVVRELENVIAQLDVRRAQVLVEAIIVEVSDTAARELGLQFLLAGQDGTVPFATTSYTSNALNLLALTGAIATDSFSNGDSGDEDGDGTPTPGSDILRDAALNSLLGINGLALGVGGQEGDVIFGAILNAVDSDVDSNILSTPSVLTLDNEEASLSVGQEIPISTGEVLSEANNNPFRTIEREEIGVKLNVRPQIGEGNTIKLFIAQEVSDLVGTLLGSEPITSLRTIETTVLADDGEVIVLGGLIQDDDTIEETKVPVLGDIPVVGRAFRNEARSRQRTNLMVFIRPTIVRDADDARGITNRKYNYMRNEQYMATEGENSSMDRVMETVVGPSPQAVTPPPQPQPQQPVQTEPVPEVR